MNNPYLPDEHSHRDSPPKTGSPDASINMTSKQDKAKTKRHIDDSEENSDEQSEDKENDYIDVKPNTETTIHPPEDDPSLQQSNNFDYESRGPNETNILDKTLHNSRSPNSPTPALLLPQGDLEFLDMTLPPQEKTVKKPFNPFSDSQGPEDETSQVNDEQTKHQLSQTMEKPTLPTTLPSQISKPSAQLSQASVSIPTRPDPTQPSPQPSKPSITPSADLSTKPVPTIDFHIPGPHQGHRKSSGNSSQEKEMLQLMEQEDDIIFLKAEDFLFDCGDISLTSNEESYYLNPKVCTILERVRHDLREREEFLKHITVAVEDPVAINQDNILSLQAFRLVVKFKDENFNTVSRRFNDFLWLEKALVYDYFGRIIPKCPPKNILTKVNMSGEKFMKQRRVDLERYSRKILSMKSINLSQHVFMFFFTSRREFALHRETTDKQLTEVKAEGVAGISAIIKGSLGSYFGRGKATLDSPEQVENLAGKLHEVSQVKELFQPLKSNLQNIIKADYVVRKGLRTFERELCRLEAQKVDRFDATSPISGAPAVEPDDGDAFAKSYEVVKLLDTLEKDLTDIEATFLRKAELESYLLQLRAQMEGKDRNEFSDYSIIESKYTLLQEKYRGFGAQVEIDFQGCLNKVKDQFRKLLSLSVTYFS